MEASGKKSEKQESSAASSVSIERITIIACFVAAFALKL